MRPIQVLLGLMLVVTAAVYFGRLRSRLWDRVIVLATVVVAMALVMFPDASSVLAHRLGVGRGADLVTYVAILGFLFVLMVQYVAVRELQAKVVELARLVAKVKPDGIADVGTGPPTWRGDEVVGGSDDAVES